MPFLFPLFSVFRWQNWVMGIGGMLLCLTITAQNPDPQKEPNMNDLEEMMENIANDSEDANTENNDTYLETLNDYVERPLNLNKVTEDELHDFPFLTPQQINGILDYREKYGPFINRLELQAIPELDLRTAKMMEPFVRETDLMNFNIPLGKLLFGGTNTVFLRYQQFLQPQEGYQKLDTLPDGTAYSAYKGSPQRLYARYRYNYSNKISYGITAEKDPGEEFLKGSNKKGFDFYSAHFYIRNVGIFKHIAVGDYEVRLGQGLTVFTGLGNRKSSYVMNVSRQSPVIKPYTSVNEALFFRGAATTLSLKKFELTLFGSYKPLDVSIDTFLVDQDGEIIGEITENDDLITDESGAGGLSGAISGLHRTPAEIARRNTVQQLNAGGSFGYKSRRFSLAANAFYSQYSVPVLKATTPYQYYSFNGDHNINASIDYKYTYKNFNFFGETAMSQNGGVATLNGAMVGMGPRSFLSVAYRHYSPDYWYHPFYTNAFGENSKPANENGLFVGTILKPHRFWTINAYADTYKHPWLKSGADAPSYGNDYLLKVTYQPERTIEVYAMYRHETKMENSPETDVDQDYLTPHSRSNVRAQVQYKITPNLTLRSRAEWSWFSDGFNPREKGYAIMQDIIYKPLSQPISFNARFALFDTDSYNSRIYAYENDVLYVFSIPPYYNQGTRFYITMRYKPFKSTDIWLRFAQTNYTNLDEIGTGNERIDGHVRSEIKAMFRYKF